MRMKSLRVLRLRIWIMEYNNMLTTPRAETSYWFAHKLHIAHVLCIEISFRYRLTSTVYSGQEKWNANVNGERRKRPVFGHEQKIALSQSINNKCNEMPHTSNRQSVCSYICIRSTSSALSRETHGQRDTQHIAYMLCTQIHQTHFPFISLTSIHRPKASETKII